MAGSDVSESGMTNGAMSHYILHDKMIVSLEIADIEVELDPHGLVTPVVPNTPSKMMQSEPLESEVVQ